MILYTQAEIASKYKIPASTIPAWVRHFLGNAENVFKGKQLEKNHKEELSQKEKHIDELHKKIGELTISVDFLKKNIEKLEFHIRKKLTDTEINLSLTKQCRLLGVSRSSIYYKPKVKSEATKNSLKEEIIEIYKEIPFYGYIRTQKELLERGYSCSVKEVKNIRQELGLKTLIPQKQPNYKRNNHNKYPYLLKHFTAKYSNHAWASDITYIKLRRGMLYKVAIMDIFSRKILGYKVSNTLNKAFCIDLLKETIDKYGVPEIFNTDQGSQYTSDEFIKVLKSNGVKISMDGVGRALDNIFIERYWKPYKYESVYLHNYFSVFDAKMKTKQYVRFYNSRRFHSSLDYKTPDQIYFSNLPKNSQAMQNDLALKKLS